jgi:peptidoglycan lytic transglycosylase
MRKTLDATCKPWFFDRTKGFFRLVTASAIFTSHPALEKSGASAVEVRHIALALFAGIWIGCGAGSVQSVHTSRGIGHQPQAAREREPARGKPLGPTHIVSSSWYGPGYEGRRTSSGERFDPKAFTAASNTIPLGSKVKVTNPKNGRSTQVKVNDRGPSVKGRTLDLSPAAAQKIGLTKSGVARVEITPVD